MTRRIGSYFYKDKKMSLEKVKLKVKLVMKDHQILNELLGQISIFLNEDTIKNNIDHVILVLNKITKTIDMHLKLEDEYIYPSLIACDIPHISKTAKEFQKEMRTLSDQYKTFSQKWHSLDTIKNDLKVFTKELVEIVYSFSDRLDREEKELYILLDEVD
ncbi:MAG: hemerythrin domain-containing protein [Bdellovibrionales bacterium]|nr:hemerythrin domain-containing protein [Bdellovibrionales bacterium]